MTHNPAWLGSLAQTGYVHERRAGLPWPLWYGGMPLAGASGTAVWALRELARLGVVVPPRLVVPAAQVLEDVYELGYDDG